MTISKIDTRIYYLNMAAMIIITAIQALFDLLVFRERILEGSPISTDSIVYSFSNSLFDFTLAIIPISAMLLYVQMLRVDIDSDFTARLKRFAKFALITLGGVLGLVLALFILGNSLEIWILILFGILLFLEIYTIGSIIMVLRLSAKTDEEKKLQRALILTPVSILLINIYFLELPVEMSKIVFLFRAIMLILIGGGLIYSNYSLKEYRLNPLESSDKPVENHISAD